MPTVTLSDKNLKVFFDTGRLENFLEENSHQFRGYSRDAVRWGAIRVALAASAATKIAPKRRQIVKHSKKPGAKRNKNPYLFYAKKPTGQTNAVYIPIFASSKESAREKPKAQIRRRGLGQNAWKWMVRDMNRSVQLTNPQRFGASNRRYFDVRNRSTHPTPSIHLFDKLKYATLAFKMRGRATADNIMQRAENAMRTQLEKRIKGRLASRSGLHSG